ncbi:MAG: TonB family protein [Woeseiaceae bacterium]
MVVQIKNVQLKNNIKAERHKTNIQSTLKSVTKKAPLPNLKNKEQPTPVQPTSINKNSEKSKERIASIIYKELNRHFNYPRLAIKRSWEGKVLLSLRVTPSGKIKNIQLNTSSGYDVLDQAAIKSLSKVEFLPEMSSWLVFDIDLNFPIVYQLIEG